MKKPTKLVIFAATAWLCLIGSSRACSVCRCGDNTFQISELGFPELEQPKTVRSEPATVEISRWRFSIGNAYHNKSNTLDEGSETVTESKREFRPSIRGLYRLTNDLSVTAELPVSFLRIDVKSDAGTDRMTSSGVSDAELSAIWMPEIYHRNGDSYSAGLSANVKLPTGRNELKDDNGLRLDEHLQSGTGAFDYMFGGVVTRGTDVSRLFVSLYYRINGTNDYEYKYGDAFFYNAGVQRAITPIIAGSLQINGRYAERDLENDLKVPATGGDIIYVMPHVKVALNHITSISLSVQIPIWSDLYGDQTEKSVVTTGLAVEL
jgi:hypothetical protein